jgi:hypothetical protein
MVPVSLLSGEGLGAGAAAGGAMMVFQTFAGDLLEPLEAGRLDSAMRIEPDNIAVEHVERAFAAADMLQDPPAIDP